MNREANFMPKAPDCMANNLTSTIGPTTRNTSCAVGETPGSEATTNASASEHSDKMTASSASHSPVASMVPNYWPRSQ